MRPTVCGALLGAALLSVAGAAHAQTDAARDDAGAADAAVPPPAEPPPVESATSADVTATDASAPAEPPGSTATPGSAAPPGDRADAPRGARAEPDARERSSEESGVVVVGSSQRALERIPGAATVVTERDLARMQPMNTNEALRRVPGIYVRDEEGQGLRPNISVRGLDPTRSRRVLMLEDGIPVSLAPYSEPEMYYNPPIERMSRIEVIRGSGSILYGPQTIGGVINYVTPAPPTRETYSVRGTAGDRGFLSGQLSYGNRIGNAGFVVSLLRRQGDGTRGIRFEVTDFYSRFVLRLNSHELSVRVGVYDEGSASTYLGLTQAMFDADPNQNPAGNDWFRLRRYSASIVDNWEISSHVSLRTAVYAYMTDRNWVRQRYDRAPETNLQYAYIAGDQSIPGGAIYLRNESLNNNRHYEVFGIEPRLQARFNLGSFRNELDAGARYLAERAQLDVLTGGYATDRSGELVTDEQRDGWAVAGYVQDRFFVTRELVVVPGLRVEDYNFTRLFRRDASVDVHHRGSGSTLTFIPGASVNYGTGALTAFAGVHLGYAPPRIAASITPRGVDQMLAAEQSINYEVGARLNVGTWLRSEAALFLIDFQNEIIQVSGNESEFANGGAARHMGVESLVQLDLGRALHWPTSVYATARYTFVDARFNGGVNDGHMVPYAVPHTLNLNVGFEHPSGISAQASYSFVSDHFSDPENRAVGSNDGLFGPIPAYGTVDLMARYSHRPTGLGFTLTVKNVQGYATDAHGRPNVYIASRSPEGIFPGGYGQVMLGVRWEH